MIVTVGVAIERHDRQRGVKVPEACRSHVDAKKYMRLMLSLNGILSFAGVGLARIERSTLQNDIGNRCAPCR